MNLEFFLLVSIFLDRVVPCFVYYFRFYDSHRDRVCSSWKFRVVAGPACDLLLLLLPQKKGKTFATANNFMIYSAVPQSCESGRAFRVIGSGLRLSNLSG